MTETLQGMGTTAHSQRGGTSVQANDEQLNQKEDFGGGKTRVGISSSLFFVFLCGAVKEPRRQLVPSASPRVVAAPRVDEKGGGGVADAGVDNESQERKARRKGDGRRRRSSHYYSYYHFFGGGH